jgi:hypothetical protein
MAALCRSTSKPLAAWCQKILCGMLSLEVASVQRIFSCAHRIPASNNWRIDSCPQPGSHIKWLLALAIFLLPWACFGCLRNQDYPYNIQKEVYPYDRFIYHYISKHITEKTRQAVVNQQFRDMLLHDPCIALQKGYLGETFSLSEQEQDLITSIRAQSLSDLAKQVNHSLLGNY